MHEALQKKKKNSHTKANLKGEKKHRTEEEKARKIVSERQTLAGRQFRPPKDNKGDMSGCKKPAREREREGGGGTLGAPYSQRARDTTIEKHRRGERV